MIQPPWNASPLHGAGAEAMITDLIHSVSAEENVTLVLVSQDVLFPKVGLTLSLVASNTVSLYNRLKNKYKWTIINECNLYLNKGSWNIYTYSLATSYGVVTQRKTKEKIRKIKSFWAKGYLFFVAKRWTVLSPPVWPDKNVNR